MINNGNLCTIHIQPLWNLPICDNKNMPNPGDIHFHRTQRIFQFFIIKEANLRKTFYLIRSVMILCTKGFPLQEFGIIPITPKINNIHWITMILIDCLHFKYFPHIQIYLPQNKKINFPQYKLIASCHSNLLVFSVQFLPCDP